MSHVSAEIISHLEQWGPHMKYKMLNARQCFLHQYHIEGGNCSQTTQNIATDCSGLEAPIAALDSLHLPYKHIWSCDNCPAAQKWITANYRPKMFFADCLGREASSLSKEAVTGYMAGFPCQPFSKMNNKCAYFKDKRCRVFNAILQTIRLCLPLWCVLENVMGILRFRRTLQCRFRKFLHNNYVIISIPLCPRTLLNEPVERPRCWFILVRQDVIVSQDIAIIQLLVEKMLLALASQPNPSCHLSDRILPQPIAIHPQTRKTKHTVTPKWVLRHHALRQKLSLDTSATFAQPIIIIPSCTPRENDLLALVMAKHNFNGSTLVVDVSQSAGRSPVRQDICPTLASSSRIVLLESDGKSRILSSLDKLALHWFPVHKLQLPKGISEHDMASLTGNTQHVGTCAVAIIIAMSLVNWNKKVHNTGCAIPLSSLPQQHLHVWQWKNGRLQVQISGTVNKKKKTQKKHNAQKQKNKHTPHKNTTNTKLSNRHPQFQQHASDSRRNRVNHQMSKPHIKSSNSAAIHCHPLGGQPGNS